LIIAYVLPYFLMLYCPLINHYPQVCVKRGDRGDKEENKRLAISFKM
jgi:hypothetical protein